MQPKVAHSASRAFHLRRVQNWLPLAFAYASFYAGRYHLPVINAAIAKAYGLDPKALAIVFGVGLWTYAISVIVNGPLADKFGGRFAFVFGGLGSCCVNLAIGLLFWFDVYSARWIAWELAIAYALNMYFQSFGALSVVKINSAWFAVRERGTFGGLFGGLIGVGAALPQLLVGSMYRLGVANFGSTSRALSLCFFAPAVLIGTLSLVVWLLVRDRPRLAGYEDIHTEDQPLANEQTSLLSTMFAVVRHPVVRVLLVAEFCTGFMRQGLLAKVNDHFSAVHHILPGDPLLKFWLAGAQTVFGIAGGLAAGIVSDRLFRARRPPVAFGFYVLAGLGLLALSWSSGPVYSVAAIAFCVPWIMGVHGMLSGTAAADFGGQRAAATATGLLDGAQYVAGGLAPLWVTFAVERAGWSVWGLSLVPAAIIGALLMLTVWSARPR